MEPDTDTFAPTPDRLSEFSRAVMVGDPAGAMVAARKMTEVPLGDTGAILISVIGILWALAAVLRQVRLWTQPLVNKAAERMGEPHRPAAPRPKGIASADADGDPQDAEERNPS